MTRKKFKDMTLAELREVAREVGEACTDAERAFLDGIARDPQGGAAFKQASQRWWEQDGGGWTHTMKAYKTALYRVFNRELRDRSFERNRGYVPGQKTTKPQSEI